MPIRERQIPNSPLSGEETATIALRESDAVVANAVQHLREVLAARLQSEPLLGKSYGHPRVRIEIDMKFHWSNVALPKTEIEVEETIGGDPVALRGGDHFVEGTRRIVDVQNPNAVRQAHGIPVMVQENKRPEAGQITGDIVEHAVTVSGAPEIAPPVDTDISDEVAIEKKVPRDRRLRHRH